MKLKSVAGLTDSVEIADLPALRDWFKSRSWPRSGWVLNFVSNSSGEFTGATESSKSISNTYDLQALIGLRASSDAILTTAHTAQLEQYRRTKTAPLVLVSRSGKFNNIPALSQQVGDAEYKPVFLVTSFVNANRIAKQFKGPGIRVISMPFCTPVRIAKKLSALGMNKVIVESGKRFSRLLISENLVSELALTLVGDNLKPEDASPALQNLGIKNANLLWAVALPQTLFTRWSVSADR